jgi:uncharacterized protein YegL
MLTFRKSKRGIFPTGKKYEDLNRGYVFMKNTLKCNKNNKKNSQFSIFFFL